MDVGCSLDLDYRLRLWVPTSTSSAISVVAELLVIVLVG